MSSQQQRSKKMRVRKPKPTATIASRLANVRVGDVAQLAGEAWAAARNVMPLFNVEFKRNDTYIAPVQPTLVGRVDCLSAIAQGVGPDQRDGISIKGVSLELRFYVLQSVIPDLFRVVCFIDHENQGVAPAPTDVLESSGGNAYPIAPFNKLNLERFEILHDALLNLSPTGEQLHHQIMRLVLRDQHCRYSGPLSSSTREGNIYLMVVGNANVNATYYSTWSRYSYVDN